MSFGRDFTLGRGVCLGFQVTGWQVEYIFLYGRGRWIGFVNPGQSDRNDFNSRGAALDDSWHNKSEISETKFINF
jgi:hypothetical protein